MALTRDFNKTIMARPQRDAKFRHALFTESVKAYLAGDSATGKAILRDLIADLRRPASRPTKRRHAS
jgi:hypothetical protein